VLRQRAGAQDIERESPRTVEPIIAPFGQGAPYAKRDPSGPRRRGRARSYRRFCFAVEERRVCLRESLTAGFSDQIDGIIAQSLAPIPRRDT